MPQGEGWQGRGGTTALLAQTSAGFEFKERADASGRWLVRSLVTVGAALVLAVAVSSSAHGPRAAAPPVSAGAAALARLQSLPLQAQSLISTTVGAGSTVFAPVRSEHGYRLEGGGITARFGARRVAVGAGSASLSFASLAIARGSHLERLKALSLTAHKSKMVYDRGGLAEWYTAGPLGIEQGFTLARRPVGTERRFTLALGFTGPLHARPAGSDVEFLTRSGRLALRYGGLSATDARGRLLPVTLSVHRGELRLGVSDAGARYPLRIDPLIQQGKLVDTTNDANSSLGFSVALSADGNTALVGGYTDDSDVGAAWVFTRSGSSWSQQAKLVDDTSDANAAFGESVALSADGNTALIGGGSDNAGAGAAWVFTRVGSTWTQQGSELTPTDEVDSAFSVGFGNSVALSSDGNTALIAGSGDNDDIGAAWVFTRSGTSWSQRAKLVDSTSDPSASFGNSVALSGAGTTALIGGYFDDFDSTSDSGVGAAWVFTGSGSSWSQQARLIDNTNDVTPEFGYSVALSSDGNTALIGGPLDNSDVGAAWMFARSGSSWSQQAKLVDNDDEAEADFGGSVALSADGNTALIGGVPYNDVVTGAWPFTRSGSSWSQQPTLADPDNNESDDFASAEALSSNGTTALIGASGDNSGIGAGYVFAGGIVVNSTADYADANPGDGTCASSPATGAVCTLRGAIQAANALGGDQTIDFALPIDPGGMPLISPGSALPAVTAQVTFDGTSQPGAAPDTPGVELDGSGAGSGVDGLVVQGGSSVVRGLVVNGFSGSGVSLQGAGGDQVVGDWFGAHAGTSGFSDVPDQVDVSIGSPDAVIGGSTAADRDVFSDGGQPVQALHTVDAVNRDDPPSPVALESSLLGYGAGVRIGPGGDAVQVSGDWFGVFPNGDRSGPVDVLGHTALTAGVQVAPQGSSLSGATITGNVITDGILGVEVTAASGSAAAVSIRDNTVGPDSATPTGAVGDLIGNAVGILADGQAPGLVISGNKVQGNGLGVALGDVDGAAVTGNTVGTNAPLSDLFDSLTSQSPNPGLHNVIGIALAGAAHTMVSGNVVQGDVIGILGVSSPNSRANTITQNTVGYAPGSFPSTVKGLKGDSFGSIVGIVDDNAPGDTISDNTVELSALGVEVDGGHGVTVSGNTASADVLGILGAQMAAGALRDNTLTRSVAGLLYVHVELTPAELKDIDAEQSPVTQSDQAMVVQSPATTAGLAVLAPEGGAQLTADGFGMGGVTAAAVRANQRAGWRHSSVRTHTATPGFAVSITGNRIGVAPGGAKDGNILGAWLIGDVTGSFSENTIANNDLGGMWVGPSFEGHYPTIAISHDSFTNNHGPDADSSGSGGLGIDLLGETSDGDINFAPTPNHVGGSVPGPDGLQNYPLLAGAEGTKGSADVVGSLDSSTNRDYTVEFYASSVCNPSGNGEGQTFLKSIVVHTDGTGLATIAATLKLPSGQRVITATATGLDGTSEFSKCLKPATGKTAAAAIAPGALAPDANGDLTLDVWCLDGQTCSGTATLQTAGNSRTAETVRISNGRGRKPKGPGVPKDQIGSTKFHGRNGTHPVKVRIKLTAAARKQLKKRRRLTVTARVQLKNHKTTTTTFILNRRQ